MNSGSYQSSARRGISTATLVTSVVLICGLIVGGLFVAAYVFTEPTVEVLVEREVRIELSEFEIFPDVIDVGVGTQLTFLIDNAGDIQHDLQISDSVGTERINPGESVVLEAGVVTRSYLIWCSIKGHRESGMEAQVDLDVA